MTKSEQLHRLQMINMRLTKDWSPGEVLINREKDLRGVHGTTLKYMTAMMRADDIISTIMVKK